MARPPRWLAIRELPRGQPSLTFALGRMTHAPNISGWMLLLTIYLGIGCIIGLVEYGIARYAFRNHPHRDTINQSDMFLTSVLKNAVAWPGILFWLGMLGLLKLFLLFRRRE